MATKCVPYLIGNQKDRDVTSWDILNTTTQDVTASDLLSIKVDLPTIMKWAWKIRKWTLSGNFAYKFNTATQIWVDTSVTPSVSHSYQDEVNVAWNIPNQDVWMVNRPAGGGSTSPSTAGPSLLAVDERDIAKDPTWKTPYIRPNDLGLGTYGTKETSDTFRLGTNWSTSDITLTINPAPGSSPPRETYGNTALIPKDATWGVAGYCGFFLMDFFPFANRGTKGSQIVFETSSNKFVPLFIIEIDATVKLKSTTPHTGVVVNTTRRFHVSSGQLGHIFPLSSFANGAHVDGIGISMYKKTGHAVGNTTESCDLTLTPSEYWPFKNRLGQLVYDSASGAQLNDPFDS